MNFNRKLTPNDQNNLKDDGFIILPNFIRKTNLDQMAKEIKPWLKKISFNNNFSSSIIGNNQWISHLGLCSQSAVDLALNENLINFLEEYFDENILLAEFSFQKKIIAEKKVIKWHADKGGGIAVFIFLTPISFETGATLFIPRTHKIKFDNDKYKTEGIAQYVDKLLTEKKINSSIQVSGGPGTVVMFNPNIWHALPAFSKAGREILWLKYIPTNINEEAVDHLYRQNLLSNLTKKQLQVFCVNQKMNKRGGLTQLGSQPFIGGQQINDFRMLVYYIRYLILSLFQKT